MNESERVSPNYQKFQDDHQSITIIDRNVESFNAIIGKGDSFLRQGSSFLIEEESATHKWLLLQMQALQLNPNICRRVLRDMRIDDSQSKEHYLQTAVENVFEFQERYKDKFSEEDSSRENGSFKLNSIPEKLRKSSSLNLKDIIKVPDSRQSFEESQRKSLELRKSSEIRPKEEKKESQMHSPKQKKDNLPKEFHCPICEEDYPTIDSRDFCDNKHRFCKSCIEGYMNENIRNFALGKPCKCMDSSCHINLSETRIFSFLSSECKEKYIKFKTLNDLNKDPDVRWCPRPGCESHIKRSGEEIKIVCRCGQEICFLCRAVWHEGLTCNQVLDKEIANYRKNIQVKNCPKCHYGIEKNEGCNHMTCTNCLYEFCWLCDKKYSGLSHYSWWNINGCPGMLMAQRREMNYRRICWGCLLETIVYICFFLFMIISLALAPVFLFFCACCTPLYLYLNYSPRQCNCYTFLICVLLLVLGIFLSPLTLIVGFFILIYSLIRRFCK